jgi:DNA mismatch endonuclease, patch repair protein
MMSKIRGKDTKPELIVRKLVHSLGYRFRLHRRDLPGTPDLVFPRHRKIIFVHGCFWHRHHGCKYAYTPKSRIEFWTSKFAKNVFNDEMAQRRLEEAGWKILSLWECEIKNHCLLEKKVKDFLGNASC